MNDPQVMLNNAIYLGVLIGVGYLIYMRFQHRKVNTNINMDKYMKFHRPR